MNHSLEQLTAFIAVYEEGSFAVAAHREKKHASTLSKHVSNLEIDLGFELFVRKARALEPNERADELYQYAKAIEFEVRQFNYRALSFLRELPSRLTLAIDSSILGLQLTPAVSALSRQYPTLELAFIEGDTLECIKRTQSGEADLAVLLSTEHYSLDFAVSKLLTFPVASVTSPEYARQFGIEPGAEISQHTRRQMRQIILQSFQDMGHNQTQKASHHIYRVNSFPCALDLIRHGLGWGNQPRLQCQQLIDSGELIEFSAEQEKNFRWSADAIWLASKPLSEPLQTLITALSETSDKL
ncbi:LysR family transcriptional regulator [Endozoicomonas gorgoniicola]|uniref:LysR family transcriptional regulator n=1 Tax=Endozoicomonas gorgoniicola TaxID=1234144 RepID=A0ABT3MXS3_9GAMM|nr:LysR family transcriptional regulator [Endozoicomonas gorgoniicola]MCW7554180.1 LysR family transcriptional regulator [Endozoicomonas gorgoniicola]